MIITYAGGPKSGTHEKADSAPAYIEVEDKNGTIFVYERRGIVSEGVGNGTFVDVQATYAPVGISVIEYFELSKGLHPPLALL